MPYPPRSAQADLVASDVEMAAASAQYAREVERAEELEAEISEITLSRRSEIAISVSEIDHLEGEARELGEGLGAATADAQAKAREVEVLTEQTKRDADALAGMQAAYREAAPLDAQMESIIGALPEAAQIAARASATLAAAGGQPVAEGAAPAKEPSLKELLAAQKLELVDDDPELEDPREFFETASAAAKAEGVLAQEQRASAERVAAHLARAPPQQPAAPKTVPQEDVEWVGEWS